MVIKWYKSMSSCIDGDEWDTHIRPGLEFMPDHIALPSHDLIIFPFFFFEPEWPKNKCPCIIEDHLFTKPILNALQLQGPKYFIYVHLVKNAIDLDFIPKLKPSKKRVINLEVENITRSSSALRTFQFMWLTNWKYLCCSKMKLTLVCF